jgi:hypothetical protein
MFFEQLGTVDAPLRAKVLLSDSQYNHRKFAMLMFWIQFVLVLGAAFICFFA